MVGAFVGIVYVWGEVGCGGSELGGPLGVLLVLL